MRRAGKNEAMIRTPIPVCLAAIALAACSRQPAPTQDASPQETSTQAPFTQAAPERASSAPPVASGTAGSAPVAAATADAVPQAIPAGMRGRFGLVRADCTTTRGDGKGLVIVGPDSLRFYESVARLVRASEAGASHLRGRFAYSGEGMEWRREARLDLADGGATLVLEEFGEDAVEGPRTYRRCPE